MDVDIFVCAFNVAVFFTYGVICVISLIFTFFLDTYRAIDEAVMINIIPARTITPLERNIYIIDDWLMRHNRMIGPLLILLSVADMKLFFDIVNKI